MAGSPGRLRLNGFAWMAALGYISCGLPVAAADGRLAEAVRNGDTRAVAAMLRQHVDVNGAATDGSTALHWAVYQNDSELVGRLIEAGADVNHSNRYGVPPLALACSHASARVVELLIAAGADPKAAPAGEPVLMTAARTGSVEAMRVLVAHGADVNVAETSRGQTALMWSAIENHAAVVQYLLDHGANVQARSTAGFTALMFAAREGRLDVARPLVAAGADVNGATPNGTTVLTMAIDNLRYDVAEFLLEQHADPNTVNKQGETSLHAAVRSRAPTRRRRAQDEASSAALIQQLLAHGANPNARTPKTPKITDAMVASPLRPAIDNVVNLGGATPVLLAAQAADVTALQLLLGHGGDPRIATYENTTTLMIAAGVGFVEGRERVRPESDVLTVVKMLADAGVDIDAVNERGQTAVHGAVYRAGNSIIEYLVAAGAETDVEDELGRTPLRLAETGFNQVSSVIRRESSAELLRKLTRGPARSGR